MRSVKSALVTVCLLTAALVAPLGPAAPDAPAAAATTDACGARVYRAAGGYWSCTFVDNFSGSTLDRTKWIGLDQYGGGDLCVLNNPRTVQVAYGSLRLSVVRAQGTSTPCPLRADGTRGKYAGATVTSYGRWSQQYGRMEARIRVRGTSLPGLHEAFWLWPDVRYGADSPWPASGEMDVMETYSVMPNLSVPFLHYSADSLGPVDGFNTSWSCRAPRGLWHTYTLEWTASRIAIVVDGRTCLVSTDAAPSFRKRMIVSFTQYLGVGSNAYDGRVSLPSTTEVDYVKAWQ